MVNQFAAAHITGQTGMLPALGAWEIYLKDQGRSPYTVKAFIGDLQLLATYLPPDRTPGRDYHPRPEQLPAVAANRAGRALQPKKPGAPHYFD